MPTKSTRKASKASERSTLSSEARDKRNAAARARRAALKAAALKAAEAKQRRAMASRASRARAKPPGDRLQALEKLQDVLRDFGIPSRLDIKRAPERAPASKWSTVWATIAHYTGMRATYQELSEALASISPDHPEAGRHADSIARALGGARSLARISVTYSGPSALGGRDRVRREWTIGEISSWDVCTYRAATALDPEIDERAERYADPDQIGSLAVGLTIWISDQQARDDDRV